MTEFDLSVTGLSAGTVPIVLMTTADMHARRDDELRRLVASVDRFRARHPQVPLHHVMLLQRCEDAAAAADALGFPASMEVSALPRLVPLSIARNIMINRLVEAPPFDLADALVAFPDDDAWYPDGTLDYVHQRFTADTELDFWFCRYGSDAAFPATVTERQPRLHDVITRASSNTIALRGRLLDAVRGFDEALGLGTPAKSGEDTDFAMRTFFAARRSGYAPCRMVGHRDFDRAIRANYYGGTLVALGRHKSRSVPAASAFIRKVLVGMALAAKRELALPALATAWKMYASNRPAINPGSGQGIAARTENQGNI